MKSGIYIIINKINNKTYIGSSKNVRRRIRDHRYKYKDDKYNSNWYNHRLYQDMRKYGLENFEFKILCLCEEKDLKEKETFYYNKYNPEYNTFVPTKDDRNKGKFYHKEETKIKIKEHNSKYWKGKKLPNEMIQSIIAGSIKKRKPVEAFKNNLKVLEFTKIGDALSYFGIDKNKTFIISSACKTNKEVFGYKWKFK